MDHVKGNANTFNWVSINRGRINNKMSESTQTDKTEQSEEETCWPCVTALVTVLTTLAILAWWILG